jgi:hypothetical protein
MKKSQSLEKKIMSYSAIATGILAISATAQGQIIYHDVNPDVSLTGNDSLNLDINTDGIIDFTLYHTNYVSGSNQADVQVISARDTNKVLTSGSSYTRVLNNNDRISDKDTVWGSYGYFLLKGIYNSKPIEFGNWKGGITDKFAGFRFAKNGNWYYGWARFDVAKDAKSIKIKDWAYNSYANSQIKAGQQVSAINEKDKNNDISFYVSNKTLFIEQKKDISENTDISIYNTSGQEIRTVTLTYTKTEINLSDVAPGLYIMRIDSEKGRSSHKIILQ